MHKVRKSRVNALDVPIEKWAPALLTSQHRQPESKEIPDPMQGKKEAGGWLHREALVQLAVGSWV